MRTLSFTGLPPGESYCITKQQIALYNGCHMKAIVVLVLAACAISMAQTAPQRDYPVKPVPFTAVHVTDGFWAPRIETNRTVTTPFAFKQDEETGRMDNFIRAAKALRSEPF